MRVSVAVWPSGALVITPRRFSPRLRVSAQERLSAGGARDVACADVRRKNGGNRMNRPILGRAAATARVPAKRVRAHAIAFLLLV
ncbi:MAG TPA: hypothetical protein VN153_04495, partial [Tahibacter sp.]|nr:hypothetical protein [Tahibacter sp.]